MTRTDAPTELSATLPDGRRVAVAAYGDPAGPAVVLLPSGPGSRRIDPDPAATAAAGVRLLVVDRPGYGGSDPLPAGAVPTLPAVADVVAAALADLGVRDAGVVGWSSGGWVAAALAARHPDLVRALAVVGSPAPDDEVPWVGEEHRAALRTMRRDPAGALAALAAQLAPLAGTGGDAALVGAGPADERLLADPQVRERVEAMLREAVRPGVLGMATDVVAVNVSPPGFDLGAVGARTTLFYAEQDAVVPLEAGGWWAARVPGARLETVAGVGHLLLLPAWGRVLAAVR
ncbi:alpha/beta fold hydrolase [Vallicoccus soli]|uniref:Alpha/beta hydrolase n=1 Tax=Vallicoccus soli TaxID=2339232 RepID=A0A3A3Z4W9_9ACTN|nr:alpha/beta hydrolase [Vallicoccus soli]RJK98023.1 alpha/beta hydrolase [Vallicoccus soli]